ncbi:alpha-tubulin folding cofactor [Ectocarpus siliculosus]|uniref:Alpha-tubulin folding cofactor n=1 Tax=Ectocarpus siliculosus TaxID=2880 RepID=D8LGT0_ECTSI|nr:alpha-tubulin folding cofactor [Ectocarpus siliculosus]|eukprot:CBN79100.1 alpha-tubulin folding cofactor [Ectocarpus siliculosus]
MAADLAALKDWVTAADGEQFSRLPEGVVSVNISHSNITARMIELKFDLSQTLGDVKGKIYTHCGTNPGMQKLSLRSGGQTMCQLDDDSKKLGFYGVQSGMEIHVTDDDPFSLTRGGALEDLSRVQKYRMSEEDYDKREGTLRITTSCADRPVTFERWRAHLRLPTRRNVLETFVCTFSTGSCWC